MRAAYLDGHVASYGPEELTGVKVIWKVDTRRTVSGGHRAGGVFHSAGSGTIAGILGVWAISGGISK